MILRGRVQILGLAAALTITLQGPDDRQKPKINEEFPIRSGRELSPPIVAPVGECAKAVHVSGFIPHAIVRVFVNGTSAGAANPYFAEADIAVSPPLKLNDAVTATQEVLGFTSSPSAPAMIVGPYPANLNKPKVLEPLYACGRVVPVDNLNPGTVVDVYRNGSATPIGEANVTRPWTPVVTASLNQPDMVTAVQTACPNDPGKKKVSPTSAAVPVNAAPNPPSPPTVENYPVGADAVVLDGLFVGADLKVTDNSTPVGGGLATADRNKAPVQPPTTAASHVQGVQSLCTSSGPGPAVGPSSTLGTPMIVPPLCEGQPFVTVANTYPNSIVVLFRNGSIAGMAGGDLGNITMALGGGAKWALGDEAQVLQYVGSTISPKSAPAYANCSKQNVVTQHNDKHRSGANLAEAVLKPSNVNPSTFGLLYTRSVEGDTVSQPLYVHGVRTASGLKNLIFVTTSLNNVYAFDADNKNPSAGAAALVWQRHLCGSVLSGVCTETASRLVGITSTPVIDVTSQTMYVVARCSDGSGNATDGAIYVYALNIADGTERVPHVQVQATAPNSGPTFDYRCQRNRPGLLLSKGVMYAAFATFSCDGGCPSAPFHGWVIGYRESDLKQVAVYSTSTSGGQAGIWQTGNGLAASADGSIYFETGNAPTSEPLQDSFVKLVPTNGPGGLALAGHFQPNNASNAPPWGGRNLSDGDTDLGSGGPMLLPGGRLIGGGKQGRYYVVDQSTMKLTQDARPLSAGFDGFQAFINQYHNDSSQSSCPVAGGASGCDPTGAGGKCYIDQKRYGDGELCGPNIHGGPIYWQRNTTSGTIFEMPEKDFLKGFHYDPSTGHVNQTPVLQATGAFAKPPTDGMPGGFSSLSAMGNRDGIIWTSMPIGDSQWVTVPGRLAAFDATTLKQLWNDSDVVSFAKSVPPTIADGNVIRATASNQILVYGLLKRPPHPFPHPWPFVLCYTLEEKYADYGGEIGILGKPLSEEKPVGDKRDGRYREFRGNIPGMTNTITSEKAPEGMPMPTCSVPPGKETLVDSRIYWSRRTCAHVVMGQILKLYLQLGGPNGKLGYPVEDETYSPDHYGRISVFEHGEIVWHPNKGARVAYKEPDNHKEDDDRKREESEKQEHRH
jgi:hypothetical protein